MLQEENMAENEKEGVGIPRVQDTLTTELLSEGTVHTAVTMEEGSTSQLLEHWGEPPNRC